MKLINNFLNFKNLLNIKDKKKINLILFYQFLGSLLEAFGLALIIPFLSIFFENENFLSKFTGFSTSLNINQSILFGLLIILIFYFFKNFILIFIYKKIFKFAFNLQFFIKSKIYQTFIEQDFEKFIKKGSSQLMSTLSVDLNIFTQNFIVATFVFFIEIFVLISISLFLFFFNPLIFLSAGITCILFVYIFTKFFRKKINKIGNEKQDSEQYLQKILNNTLNFFQGIKIFSKENYFLERFNKENYKSSNLYGNFIFFQNIPRLIFEFFVVFLIVLLVILMIFLNYDQDQIFITLALFTAAAFRLMPSINRIIYSYQGIIFSEPTLKKIIEFTNNTNFNKKNVNEISEFNSLEFKNLSFKFKEKTIFENLNLKINKGDFVGVFGPSGVGKTTLVNLIVGLLKPTSGKYILNNNKDSLNHTPIFFGYVPQFINLIDDNLKTNITLSDKDEVNLQLFNEITRKTKIDDLVENYGNENIGERGAKISGGQFQRINLARALYSKPTVLILDEATSALDQKTENDILNEIFKLNKKDKITVILISHKLENLKNCNKKFKIEDYKVKKTN